MPYIKEENRTNLDPCIEDIVECLKNNIILNSNKPYPNKDLSEEELLIIIGDINYCFTRVIAMLMGGVTYNKIAIITGVLENVKQEFYRRVVEPYENKKIAQNGDIKEYKKLK